MTVKVFIEGEAEKPPSYEVVSKAFLPDLESLRIVQTYLYHRVIDAWNEFVPTLPLEEFQEGISELTWQLLMKLEHISAEVSPSAFEKYFDEYVMEHLFHLFMSYLGSLGMKVN